MRRPSRLLCALVLSAAAACRDFNHPAPGRIIWRTDGRGWGTPTFDESTVYFVGFDHEIIAADRNTGAVRWRAHSPDPGVSTHGRSAVIAGDVVAFGDLDIHAFDRRTGALRWRFTPTDGYYPGLFYLATDGTTIYAGSPSGRVYAVDAISGAERWHTIIADDDNTSVFDPVLDDGTVFVCVKHFTTPTTGAVVALNTLNGDVRWIRELPNDASPLGTGCELRVAISGNVVAAASDVGFIYGLDLATGVIRWTAPQLSGLPPGTGGSTNPDVRPLTSGGGLIVAGSLTGFLTAYDAATGEERWRSTAHQGSAGYPLATDGETVYATHSGLQLAAFDLHTGEVLWVAGGTAGRGEYYPTPAPDSDRLFVSGLSGLYALRK